MNETSALTTTRMGNNSSLQYSQVSIFGQTCFLILILIAALVGNCLVITAVVFYRKLRKSTNYFIVSLAVSDILIAVTIMPFRVHHLLNRMVWDLGPKICQLWFFMDFLCSTASIANVSLISIDRFLALSYPFKYPRFVSGRRCAVAIGLVWCYSGLLALLSLRDWSDDAVLGHSPACSKQDKVYYSFSTVLGILVPVVILVVAYSMVFRVALRQALVIKSHSAVQLNPRNDDRCEIPKGKADRSIQTRFLIREMKATKTLMIVVGTFLVCWFPLFVIILVVQYCPKCISQRLNSTSQQIIGVVFVYILPRLNSAVNPIIYSIFNREFRAAICLLCNKIASVLPPPNSARGVTIPGRRGGFCGQKADHNSTSDNSAAYEPNTEPYYALASTNGATSWSPSCVFTFKNQDTCYHETTV